MSSLAKLFEPLNLIYYEYDARKHSFSRDNSAPKNHLYSELMKITHELSRHHIDFFIDAHQSIILTPHASWSLKFKHRVATLVRLIKNRFKPVYLLNDKKIKGVKNLPMFEIKPINTAIDFSRYEALIFTSKNGIEALQSFHSGWKNLPSYVIAPQTAKVVKKYGGKLGFVGKTKHGDSFALELIKALAHKRVLYVRGAKTVSNIAQILADHEIVCDEVIVYETVCKTYDTPLVLPKKSRIIFSSPSTIECFFKNVTWDESFKAIAIGNTTARYFPDTIVPIIADTTSIESCVKKAYEL